jgi:hypothetical protein
MTISRRSRHKSKPRKPNKPRPDWPLFPHNNGLWCKEVKGKLHYFGVWADPDAALNKRPEQKDDLLAGWKPRLNQSEIKGRVVPK